MSTKIRLSRIGKKNSPVFRLVASQTRTKRNGKFLDVLGSYNPADAGKTVIDMQKVDLWVKKGALITDAAQKLIDGKYNYVKYSPGKEKVQEEPKQETQE